MTPAEPRLYAEDRDLSALEERIYARALAELNRQYAESYDGPYTYGEGEEPGRIGVDGRVDVLALTDALLREVAQVLDERAATPEPDQTAFAQRPGRLYKREPSPSDRSET